MVMIWLPGQPSAIARCRSAYVCRSCRDSKLKPARS
jgi:hypothetical protein